MTNIAYAAGVFAIAAVAGTLGFFAGKNPGADPSLGARLRRQTEILERQQAEIAELSRQVRALAQAAADHPSASNEAHERALAASGAAPTPPAQATMSPESIAAHQQSLLLVEHAIARSRWDESDRAELGKLWEDLTQQQAADILTRISTAVGTGKLRLDLERGHTPL